ncbi:hypothetical protein N865_20690 [Intrasporangium oryzae NRRL B-24470]|uniref:Uncharacterized protein n=1 Tax=Intrasporangium oryzae NRRL B-24470 TaxID=1386089 RepID=W9G4S8_9MICO|nr:hypothetical protein N865_20690 [Intrasporangium oryzae NRRL B-24470]
MGEAVAEGLFAVLACSVAGAVIAAFIWGWNRHPVATVTASAAMACLLGYGAWSLRPNARQARERGQGRRVAAIASGALLVTAVWLFYVITYCTCA